MREKYKKYFRILGHVSVPIFFGVAIYGLFRGLHFIDPKEIFFPLYSVKPPKWVLYNLPDGLWFYSLISAITFIWQGNLSKYFLGWFFFVVIAAYLSEFFQALHLIPGTFDWNDILAYSLAILAYILNFKTSINQLLKLKRQKDENKKKLLFRADTINVRTFILGFFE